MHLLQAALVSLAVVATFGRGVPYPLQESWDDGRFIVDNPLVRSVSLEHLVALWSRPHFEAYHPLHLLSYWLDVPWAGPNGPVLHAVSLALWVLAANLVLVCMRRAGLGSAAAVIATLALCLHPAQVEVVSWATGRKDVLSLVFVAAATALHLASRTPWDLRAWGARGAYLLAVLSKTTALPLPLVLLSFDVLVRRQRARRALRTHAVGIALGAGMALGVLAIWHEAVMIRQTAGGLLEAPARVASTLTHQLATALWPANNAPMYATRALGEDSALGYVWIGAIAAAIFVALRRDDDNGRRFAFGLVAFVLWMLPVSNAVPMYFPFQDRYLSLPLLGLAFALGATLDAPLRQRSKSALALGAAAVIALAARSVQYQGRWASETRLWGHAAATQPDAFYAWLKLGEVRRDAGDLDGAIRAYRRLVESDPSRKLAHAALLQALALHDERTRGLTPSRAEHYARRYYEALGNAAGLRRLASQMLSSGHLSALELPLSRLLELVPVSDPALERAALTHFREGRPSLGLFYLRQMRAPTGNAELRSLAEAARAR